MLGAAVAMLSSPVGSKAVNQGIGLLIRGSWKTIADFCSEQYAAEPEIQRLSRDLEIRLGIIQRPLDVLALHVAKGNQSLEGARDVAVAIVQDIDEVIQEITKCRVLEARKEERSDDTGSPVQWARRLKQLLQRLDSLMPYLNVALSASTIASISVPEMPKMSRLLWASGLLQKLRSKCSKVDSVELFSLQEGTLLTRGRRDWETKFMDCAISLTIQWDSTRLHHPYRFVLNFAEIFPDGKVCNETEDDHENAESSQTSNDAFSIDVCNITTLDWSTTQALLRCSAEFDPALVLSFHPVPTNSTVANTLQSLAVQCRFHTSEGNTVESVQREWNTLGRLEYLLHLASLESQHEACHTEISDLVLLRQFGRRSEEC